LFLAPIFAVLAATFQTIPGIYNLSQNNPTYFAMHGECYELTSRYGGDQVVLTGDTEPEWESFINYAHGNSNIEVQNCPVQYSGWSGGACSETCGGGTMTETRQCIFIPAGTAVSCDYCGGQCERTSSCNEQACGPQGSWQRSCPPEPSLNLANDPATCGRSCTVTCEIDGVRVSADNCAGSPPSDYIAHPLDDCLDSVGACTLPWGGTINHNETVDAYLEASVPHGDTCTGETRVCSAGVLSGSYEHPSCVVGDPQECTLPWGGTLAHGDSTTAYQSASVPHGDTCTGETRVCDDGTLSGSYAHPACEPVPAPTDCTLPWGGTIESGQSVTAYSTATVGFGQMCVSETRVCNAGVLSGSHAYQNCTVEDPVGCSLPWGGAIAHGGSVSAYATNSVEYGETCSAQTRQCHNGRLSGTYRHQNCTVGDPLDCTLPWGGTLAHGDSVTAYSTETVAHDQTCGSETRTCDNGTLSGSNSYVTCTRDDPPADECEIKAVKIDNWNSSRGTTRGCQIRCQEDGLISVRTDESRTCESTETRYSDYNGRSTNLYWDDNSLRCYASGQKHDDDRSDKVQYCYCGADSSCNGQPFTGSFGSSGGGSGGGGGGGSTGVDGLMIQHH
jgi:hypothetical protein